MKNNLKINTDGLNVYVQQEIKSNKIALTILSLLVGLALIGFIFLFSNISEKEIPKFIIPFFLITGFFIFVPFRYLLWNLKGRENITITTKSIHYSHDYGLIQTKEKSKKFNVLGLGFEQTRKEKEIEYGNLVFVNYRETDNYPEEIYRTSVVLNKSQITELEDKIFEIFSQPENIELEFKGFSIN